MKVKKAELSGVQLDYAVAVALGVKDSIKLRPFTNCPAYPQKYVWLDKGSSCFSPSSNWMACGPLIEQFQMFIEPPHDVHRSMIGEDGKPKGCWETYDSWHATVSTRVAEKPSKELFGYEIPGGPYRAEGETPLIAICRAVVASKLGDTVDIPDELMEVRE